MKLATFKPKSAMGFIFITMLIDFTGFGIIIPGLPSLIVQLTGHGLQVAALYAGWLTISYSAVQFLSAPIIGGLSDQYGRRPVLLASLFGLGIDYLFLALAPTIGWLFVGRIIAGITGASFTTAQAYIADVSTPEKRAQNFGMVGAAFGIGFIVGPLIGGIFSQYGLRVPFYIAAGFSLINWLYGYFILPESLAIENRRPFAWKRANPVGSFLNLSKYKTIAGLLLALFLLYLASHAVQFNWAYYTKEKFSWNAADIGYSLGFVGLVVGIVQGGLIRIIIPKIGNNNAVYVGFVLYTLGFVLFAFASSGWMMYAFMIPYGFGGICGPAMQGITSNGIPANSQGEMQGLLTGLMSLGAIFGPLAMSYVFSHFIDNTGIYFPGAPFILAAILTTMGLLISFRTLRKYHSKA